MKREQIIAQALRCIDEIYPEDNAANSPNFPLADFIDEAGRRVLLAAPLHTISSVESLAECPLRPNPDGSGEIDLPADFLRLARLRMDGWQRPVLVALPEDHPAATYQYHPVTRGGMAKRLTYAWRHQAALFQYYGHRSPHSRGRVHPLQGDQRHLSRKTDRRNRMDARRAGTGCFQRTSRSTGRR